MWSFHTVQWVSFMLSTGYIHFRQKLTKINENLLTSAIVVKNDHILFASHDESTHCHTQYRIRDTTDDFFIISSGNFFNQYFDNSEIKEPLEGFEPFHSFSSLFISWLHNEFRPLIDPYFLTLTRPLRRKLRIRWFFDLSEVKESSFSKSDLTDPSQIFDAHLLENTNSSPSSFHFSVDFIYKI